MKVYLRTFGCRANQYDSETVRAMVEASGAEIVATPGDADVAVFNSCAVTAEAEVDLRKSVRRAARERPALKSIVMGCAAALDRGAIRGLPTVEAVVPGSDFAHLAAALALPPPALGIRAPQQAGTRALLRIQDGCDEHCTFCATTLARGDNRSRPADEIVREAEALAERHAEIVLTGIHIGTYGYDIGATLGALVEQLVRTVPSARFRLSSIEATEVDERLQELLRHPAQVAPHLHAPLQSGSNRVLKRMGRHWYTAEAYAAAIERIVSEHEIFGLGADVIAGFPGETDDDHRRTCDVVESLPFTYLHVFPYSARPGTAATRLGDQLPKEIIDQRARGLRAIGARKLEGHRAKRAGGDADVVAVQAHRGEGITEDFLTVALDDPTISRGTRFRARLSGDAHRLIATAHPRMFR